MSDADIRMISRQACVIERFLFVKKRQTAIKMNDPGRLPLDRAIAQILFSSLINPYQQAFQ